MGNHNLTVISQFYLSRVQQCYSRASFHHYDRFELFLFYFVVHETCWIIASCAVWYSVVISYTFILTNRMTNLVIWTETILLLTSPPKWRPKVSYPYLSDFSNHSRHFPKNQNGGSTSPTNSNHFPPIAQPGVHIFITSFNSFWFFGGLNAFKIV